MRYSFRALNELRKHAAIRKLRTAQKSYHATAISAEHLCGTQGSKKVR